MGVNGIEYIRLHAAAVSPLPPSVIPGLWPCQKTCSLGWRPALWTEEEKRNFPENGTEREKQLGERREGDDDVRGAIALGRFLQIGNCQFVIPVAKTENFAPTDDNSL